MSETFKEEEMGLSGDVWRNCQLISMYSVLKMTLHQISVKHKAFSLSHCNK